ncbi:MAG TPA: hypothetical protein VF411_06970 [Bacteroidia bacterium]
MDNIKHRLEFFQNESENKFNFTPTEVMAISAMKEIVNISLENRFFILDTMQNALRIEFEDYERFYTTNWLAVQKEAFK